MWCTGTVLSVCCSSNLSVKSYQEGATSVDGGVNSKYNVVQYPEISRVCQMTANDSAEDTLIALIIRQ